MCYNTHESQEGLIKNCQNHNETAKPYALKKYKGEVKMQQKTKKLTSLILLFSLLISMFTLLSVAADTATAPTNDAEAIAAGYQAKYTDAQGAVQYIKFDTVKSGDRANDLVSVPENGTVTLLADVTIGFELLLNGKYTVEGNGKTVNGAIRSDSGSANVILQNLTLNSPAKLGNGNAYLYQINAGNVCTFKNCTVNINGTPSFGAVIARGTLNFENTVINYTTEGTKPLFYNDNGTRKINMTGTSAINISGNAALFHVADVSLGTVGAGCSFKLKDNVEFTVPGVADITNTADWAMPNEGITPAGGKEGFRVGTVVSKSWWDANKGVTVKEWGTMIDVASQVKDGDKFSLTMLKASDNKYATVANDGWFREDANADTLCFYGVLTGIASEKANTEFGGIGYITLTVPGLGEFTYYGNGAFFQNSAE